MERDVSVRKTMYGLCIVLTVMVKVVATVRVMMSVPMCFLITT